jgi:RNase P protein component
MSGTTVHTVWTGRCALYLTSNVQYNAHRNIGISPIAAQTSSLENWRLNIRNCNYIVYVRDHSWRSVNRRMCPYLAPRLEYNAHWIVDISPIAAQIRTVEYWSLNMQSCNYIVYLRDTSSHCVNWRLCAVLAPCFQYNAHWIVVISPISAQTSSLENCCLNIHNCNYIVFVLDHSPHSINWSMCPNLAPRLQYNAHWIDEISPISAQISSVEYSSLNMRSCKYIVYVRDHSSHCVNWRLCAVLAPRLQYNARRIVDISPIAAVLRFVEYLRLNMWSCNYTVSGRDHSSDSVNWRMCSVFGITFAV